MANTIKISGVLVGEHSAFMQSDGRRITAISLEFHKGQGPILLCAVDSVPTELLRRFSTGDLVEATGELLVNPSTLRSGVLLESIKGLRRCARDQDRCREVEDFNTSRNHKKDSRVVGLGTAARAVR
jgi:hypothetical protein